MNQGSDLLIIPMLRLHRTFHRFFESYLSHRLWLGHAIDSTQRQTSVAPLTLTVPLGNRLHAPSPEAAIQVA